MASGRGCYCWVWPLSWRKSKPFCVDITAVASAELGWPVEKNRCIYTRLADVVGDIVALQHWSPFFVLELCLFLCL